MGVYCDECGHYMARVKEEYSESEWEHLSYMYEVKLEHYVAMARNSPSLIDAWERDKERMAKDLTSIDCNFPHVHLDAIKERLEEESDV